MTLPHPEPSLKTGEISEPAKESEITIPRRAWGLLALLIFDFCLIILWGWHLFGHRPNLMAYLQTVFTVVGVPLTLLGVIFAVRRPVVLEELLSRIGTSSGWSRITLALSGVIIIVTVLFWLLGWVGQYRSKNTSVPTNPLPPEEVLPFEENDRQEEAYGPLLPGLVYLAPPNDQNDWYYFVLSQTSSVHITVNNYSAKGQVAVYVDNPGGDPPREPVANDGQGGRRMEIPNELLSNALRDLPPGRYYIRIYSVGDMNSNENYRLIFTLE